MTTGLKTPSSYYLQLVNAFPPRPIVTDAEFTATQTQIHKILDQSSLNQDDRDYLKVLGMLVYDYEEQHEPMPKLQGVELLQALMVESNLQPQDLAPILDEHSVQAILAQQQQISDRQAEKLAAFFRLSPGAFRAVH